MCFAYYHVRGEKVHHRPYGQPRRNWALPPLDLAELFDTPNLCIRNPRCPWKNHRPRSPPLQTRRLICKFTEEEYARYRVIAADHERKLVRILANGNIVWTKKHSRAFTLKSTWLGFHLVDGYLAAGTVKAWKAKGYLLHAFLSLLHREEPRSMLPLSSFLSLMTLSVFWRSYAEELLFWSFNVHKLNLFLSSLEFFPSHPNYFLLYQFHHWFLVSAKDFPL